MSATLGGRHQAGDMVVIGYCVHCRYRRQMNGAIQVCNRRGGRDLKGLCSVCGKSMYRLGGWDSVAAAQESARQEAAKQESAKISLIHSSDKDIIGKEIVGKEVTDKKAIGKEMTGKEGEE